MINGIETEYFLGLFFAINQLNLAKTEHGYKLVLGNPLKFVVGIVLIVAAAFSSTIVR